MSTSRMVVTYQRGTNRRGKTKKKAMSPAEGKDQKMDMMMNAIREWVITNLDELVH